MPRGKLAIWVKAILSKYYFYTAVASMTLILITPYLPFSWWGMILSYLAIVVGIFYSLYYMMKDFTKFIQD